jgi:hypothetical protein
MCKYDDDTQGDIGAGKRVVLVACALTQSTEVAACTELKDFSCFKLVLFIVL